jgi:hypothetical protein
MDGLQRLQLDRSVEDTAIEAMSAGWECDWDHTQHEF